MSQIELVFENADENFYKRAENNKEIADEN